LVVSDKDLSLNLRLDKSPAKAAAEAVRADLQEVNAGMLLDTKKVLSQEAEAHRALNQTVLSASVATQRADVAAHQQANERKRDATGRFAADMTQTMSAAHEKIKAKADATKDAHVSIGTAGTTSFASVLQAIPGVLAGMDKLIAGARMWGDAVKEAADRMRNAGQATNNELDSVAKVAALKGRTADAAFVQDLAKERTRTGQTKAEQLKGQEAFMNSGAQFIGDGPGKLSQKQADQAYEATAKLAVAKNVDAGAMADLTGRAIGMKDYSKFGADASKMIAADVNQMMAVPSAGGGDESHLAGETAKVAAATVNEDALKGVFKSGKDVTKLVSVMNEVAPGAEAEATNALLRTVRGFDKGKGGAFLKKSGVTAEGTAFSAIEKLSKSLRDEAQRQGHGITIQDVINQNFEDEQGRKALGAAVNKGVFGGMFDQREKVAQANATPEQVKTLTDKFRGSERGAKRFADADQELIDADKGAKQNRIALLEKQAQADINRSGGRDSSWRIFAGKAVSALSLGSIDIDQQGQDRQMLRKLRARMTPELREKYKDATLANGPLSVSPEERNKLLNSMMEDIELTGANPLSDRKIDLNSPDAVERRENAMKKRAAAERVKMRGAGPAPGAPGAADALSATGAPKAVARGGAPLGPWRREACQRWPESPSRSWNRSMRASRPSLGWRASPRRLALPQAPRHPRRQASPRR
jgi:hypothetical protein